MDQAAKNLDPGVSVLMTTYNGMPYLREAVESILSQTYRNFEFIIVNDGSSDDSTDFLDSIDDPRVRVFHNENRGTAAASNFGLKMCRGRYVARMDADDISAPERLEKQFDFLESNPDVALVGSQLKMVGTARTGMKVDVPLDHEDIFSALLKLRHGLSHSACMYRNSVIREIGGYWEYRTYDDWDMFIRMGEAGRLANLPDVLLQYRTLPGSLVGGSPRIAYEHYGLAAENAKRRSEGLPEISMDEFKQQLGRRPMLIKLRESADLYGLLQYRKANVYLCSGNWIRGYSRLVWASLCSPWRTVDRVRRIIANRSASSAASAEDPATLPMN
ncbi:MAG: glycosyltransferase [Planctomycetota bacterium]